MILLLWACRAPETAVTPAVYVGSAACSPCHAEAAATWAASGHAHAYETLVEAASSHNPSCLPCHVVGWPPTENAVGCESCHGPGSAHLAAPRTRMADARQACAGCHTVDTSPDFVFPARWAAIKH